MQRTCDCGKCQKCKHREYMREYQKTEKGKANVARGNRRYRATERGRRLEAISVARYRASDKGRETDRRTRAKSVASGKNAARQAVKYAVKTGRLIQQPCQVCGAKRVHAHHPLGYGEHRLTVEWLCPLHHKAAHQ